MQISLRGNPNWGDAPLEFSHFCGAIGLPAGAPFANFVANFVDPGIGLACSTLFWKQTNDSDTLLRMEKELRERIDRLESHLAHLERQYDELNQVIIDQSRQLKRIQGQTQRIAETVENAEMDRIKSTNPKPPHYQ